MAPGDVVELADAVAKGLRIEGGFAGGGAAREKGSAELRIGEAAEIAHEPADVGDSDIVFDAVLVDPFVAELDVAAFYLADELRGLLQEVADIPLAASEEAARLPHRGAP